MLSKNENNILGSSGDLIKKFEKDIEMPVSLNLGLAYLKVKEYGLSAKYCSQALSKDPDNDKALYRRGMAYLGTGDVEKAKSDLTRAYELTQGKDSNVIKALHDLKAQVQKNKELEKELVKKMLSSGGLYEDQKQKPSEQAAP